MKIKEGESFATLSQLRRQHFKEVRLPKSRFPDYNQVLGSMTVRKRDV